MSRLPFSSTEHVNEHAAVLVGCTVMELAVIAGISLVGAIGVSITVGTVTGYTQMATLGVFFPWGVLIVVLAGSLGAFKYGKPPGHYLHVLEIWLYEKGVFGSSQELYLLCDGPMLLGRSRQMYVVERVGDMDDDYDDDEYDEDAER